MKQHAIALLIEKADHAINQEDFDTLVSIYADDAAIMLPPGSSTPIVGIEPIIESYRKFGSSAKIHKFDIVEIMPYGWGNLAICHLQFEVDYEVESGRFQEKGLEVYAINTSGPQPKVVWRTQLTLETNA